MTESGLNSIQLVRLTETVGAYYLTTSPDVLVHFAH